MNMHNLVILLIIVAALGSVVSFIGGILVLNKHKTLVSDTTRLINNQGDRLVTAFKTEADKAAAQAHAAATKITSTVTAAHNGMVRTADDIKAAMKNQQ